MCPHLRAYACIYVRVYVSMYAHLFCTSAQRTCMNGKLLKCKEMDIQEMCFKSSRFVACLRIFLCSFIFVHGYIYIYIYVYMLDT